MPTPRQVDAITRELRQLGVVIATLGVLGGILTAFAGFVQAFEPETTTAAAGWALMGLGVAGLLGALWMGALLRGLAMVIDVLRATSSAAPPSSPSPPAHTP